MHLHFLMALMQGLLKPFNGLMSSLLKLFNGFMLGLKILMALCQVS